MCAEVQVTAFPHLRLNSELSQGIVRGGGGKSLTAVYRAELGEVCTSTRRQAQGKNGQGVTDSVDKSYWKSTSASIGGERHGEVLSMASP